LRAHVRCGEIAERDAGERDHKDDDKAPRGSARRHRPTNHSAATSVEYDASAPTTIDDN
jgi:hypothetical protein